MWSLNIPHRDNEVSLWPLLVFYHHLFPSVLFVVFFSIPVMGLFLSFGLLFIIVFCDPGSIIICSRLLTTGFLLFIDFISELIYVVRFAILIIIRGSTFPPIIVFAFIVVVLVPTSTIPWWAAKLVSIYLHLLCPASEIA